MNMTVTPLTKSAQLRYVGYIVNDAGDASKANEQSIKQLMTMRGWKDLSRVRIVGWTCGFEPMCVAVVSYLPNVRLDDDEATELAVDLLQERGWFADPTNTEPDFVI